MARNSSRSRNASHERTEAPQIDAAIKIISIRDLCCKWTGKNEVSPKVTLEISIALRSVTSMSGIGGQIGRLAFLRKRSHAWNACISFMLRREMPRAKMSLFRQEVPIQPVKYNTELVSNHRTLDIIMHAMQSNQSINREATIGSTCEKNYNYVSP